MAAASGLMLTAAFPNIGFAPAAWVALVPLMFSLRHCSGSDGFRLGFLSGLVHQVTLIYWMVYTMYTYGHLPWAVSVPVMMLLSCYLALYPAFFGWAVSRFLGQGRFRQVVIWMPFLWTALEFGKSRLLSGFPWELLGHSQFENLSMIQIADMAGVYGISFMIVLANAAVFTLFTLLWSTEKPKPVSGIFTFCFCGSAALLFIAMVAYGQIRMEQITAEVKTAPEVNIAIVQGNINQAEKWDSRFQKQTVEKYLTLSAKAAKEDKPDLTVWPETAAPFYFTYEQPLTRILENGIFSIKNDFLIGAPSFSFGAQKKVSYYNSAFLVNAKGQVSAKYNKAHLVPFGEYVPFKKWLPFIGKIVEQVGDFVPGPKGQTMAWQDRHIGILICYELIFPELSRQASANGADVLINLTNDAWYGRTAAPYQHFSMAVFRAVENHRSLVRAANTGFSGFIDPVGQITGRTGLFEDAEMTRPVPLLATKTVYTRFGDIFAWGCAAMAGIIAGFMLIRRKL